MVAHDLPTPAGAPHDDDAPPDDSPQAPPVVAVVVTHDAGPWFRDALGSLRAQDYPNLSVLVIDADSATDPMPLVAEVLPDAYVRHLDANPGFGPAANEVIEVVEGAAFYAFCHDDVVLDPTAIRFLVEEAYRSNAGVVGPKVVAFGAPQHLLQVGMSSDKTGVLSPLVERGELDQEQHDRVRDVFTIPGACTLVRTDLFEALGGFDPAITFLGEDLDLCWRAQVAGARVIVVPAARVEHVEALGSRRPTDDRRRLLARHRLRTVLTCYGPFHLLRVLPQAAVFTLFEAMYASVTGHLDQAGDVLGAWTWNLRRIGALRQRRALLRRHRQLGDGEVRRLQVRGSARLSGFVRGELGTTDRVRASLSGVGRDLSDRLASGPRRVVVAAWLLVALLLLVGSRDLISGPLPAIGAFAPIEEGPLGLLREYVSGWRSAGLGSESPAPTAFALLGLLGIVVLGATGFLQQVLVLGMLPLGVVGMWRLTGPLASKRARAVAIVVYAVVPLPYDALARGRWGALVAYAAMPWILARLLRSSGEAPFAPEGEVDESAPDRETARALVETDRRRAVLVLGVIVALVAAVVPVVVLVVPLVALALTLGAVFTGGVRRVLQTVTVGLGASVVALVLHLPWTLDFVLPGSEWATVGGISRMGVDRLGIDQLLRFETGPAGSSVLHWALPVAGTLALLIGRGWRFTWATRAWFVALASWSLVWVAGQDLLPVALPSADLLLVPAAAALALAAGLGMVAFERDLPGYRFGLRQVASIVAAAAVVVASLPVLADALDGRWGLPPADFRTSLNAIEAGEVLDQGSFRVLWVGHPDVVPLGSHRLEDGLGYGISTEGAPGLTDQWAGSADGATGLVEDALRLAADGQTQRLGRLLAPMGIRFLALPERSVPERARTSRRPLPPGVRRTVDSQLDLRRLDVDPAIALYENVSWAPTRAALPAEAGAVVAGANSLFGPAVATDLSGAVPVLGESTGHLRFEGEVPAGVVYLAEAASDRWRLEVGGRSAARTRALGWANAFEVAEAGDAVLRYRTSPTRWLVVALQALLWAAAAVALVRGRRRRATEVGARSVAWGRS
ncbi:MAG TPA: glycosyltransferase family 2 protein [Acidimicrobiales bacterium]|nr:glycosyltransferase family 2 protein [Acidimicrobiales bacterium]